MEKAQQLQTMSTQLQQLQQYMQLLEEQTQETAKATESITEMTQVKENAEAFVPVTNGIYVKAKIVDTKEFLINVGNNVVTAQTAENAKKLLREQQEELEKAQESLVKQFSEMYQQYIQLQLETQEV